MLKQKISKQIDVLFRLGFHKLLNLSEVEYLHSFRFNNLIPLHDGKRFDLPVIADPRIPTEQLISKAGLENYLKPEDLTNISGENKEPYLFFTHNSKRYSTHTAAMAISEFDEDEIGCTLVELVYFYLFYPDKFEGIAIDAVLTNFRGDYHPCIIKVKTQGEIGAHWHNDLTNGINILSKGKSLFKL